MMSSEEDTRPLHTATANHRTDEGEELGVVTRIWTEADYLACHRCGDDCTAKPSFRGKDREGKDTVIHVCTVMVPRCLGDGQGRFLRLPFGGLESSGS